MWNKSKSYQKHSRSYHSNYGSIDRQGSNYKGHYKKEEKYNYQYGYNCDLKYQRENKESYGSDYHYYGNNDNSGNNGNGYYYYARECERYEYGYDYEYEYEYHGYHKESKANSRHKKTERKSNIDSNDNYNNHTSNNKYNNSNKEENIPKLAIEAFLPCGQGGAASLLEEELEIRKLFVDRIPYYVTSSMLYEKFNQFCIKRKENNYHSFIMEASIIPNRFRDRSRGYGFVTFSDPYSATLAITNDVKFGNQSVFIAYAARNPKPARRNYEVDHGKSGHKPMPSKHKIYHIPRAIDTNVNNIPIYRDPSTFRTANIQHISPVDLDDDIDYEACGLPPAATFHRPSKMCPNDDIRRDFLEYTRIDKNEFQKIVGKVSKEVGNESSMRVRVTSAAAASDHEDATDATDASRNGNDNIDMNDNDDHNDNRYKLKVNSKQLNVATPQTDEYGMTPLTGGTTMTTCTIGTPDTGYTSSISGVSPTVTRKPPLNLKKRLNNDKNDKNEKNEISESEEYETMAKLRNDKSNFDDNIENNERLNVSIIRSDIKDDENSFLLPRRPKKPPLINTSNLIDENRSILNVNESPRKILSTQGQWQFAKEKTQYNDEIDNDMANESEIDNKENSNESDNNKEDYSYAHRWQPIEQNFYSKNEIVAVDVVITPMTRNSKTIDEFTQTQLIEKKLSKDEKKGATILETRAIIETNDSQI